MSMPDPDAYLLNWGGPHRPARNVPIDVSYLTESFVDDDFDLVAKELWLHGLWLKRINPGRIEVLAESRHLGETPVVVAIYYKRWREKGWKRFAPDLGDKNPTRME